MPITLRIGDITTDDADFIVNAANRHLRPGRGVCGAIWKAAGPEPFAEAIRMAFQFGGQRDGDGPCFTPGQAVLTGPGRLRANGTTRGIIHAIGPIFDEDNPAGCAVILGLAYANALDLAARCGGESIAFPAISTGIYGYPLQEAADIAVDVAHRRGKHAHGDLDIRFVLFDHETHDAFFDAVNRKCFT